jgi:hypothetical protein
MRMSDLQRLVGDQARTAAEPDQRIVICQYGGTPHPINDECTRVKVAEQTTWVSSAACAHAQMHVHPADGRCQYEPARADDDPDLTPEQHCGAEDTHASHRWRDRTAALPDERWCEGFVGRAGVSAAAPQQDGPRTLTLPEVPEGAVALVGVRTGARYTDSSGGFQHDGGSWFEGLGMVLAYEGSVTVEMAPAVPTLAEDVATLHREVQTADAVSALLRIEAALDGASR